MTGAVGPGALPQQEPVPDARFDLLAAARGVRFPARTRQFTAQNPSDALAGTEKARLEGNEKEGALRKEKQGGDNDWVWYRV